MTPKLLIATAIVPAMSLLPESMDTPEARRMLVAMAKQESDLRYRHQVGGPAHGLWQFEMRGGTAGVLSHGATSQHARRACDLLLYDADDLAAVYAAIEHNDVLAAVFARLLLWSLPQPLPETMDGGWAQYIDAWRPGKPHRARWPTAWAAGEVAIT